jgi:hypothetical protein
MPKDLEKIRKDIMKANPSMPKSMAYALATNILKKRKAAGVSGRSSAARLKASAGYKAYEKTEPKDVESGEPFAEVAREAKAGSKRG